jgi:hypothetical protein
VILSRGRAVRNKRSLGGVCFNEGKREIVVFDVKNKCMCVYDEFWYEYIDLVRDEWCNLVFY